MRYLWGTTGSQVLAISGLCMRWGEVIFLLAVFILLLSSAVWKWGRAVVVITTTQLHSINPELRFCTGSNPVCGVLDIRGGEDLWQWFWLEIRLNVLRRWTILQKKFIIINSFFYCLFADGKSYVKKSKIQYENKEIQHGLRIFNNGASVQLELGLSIILL